MELTEAIREFWDNDAATYDRSTSHRPRSRAEVAAWSAALERLLPRAPARVLDVGAGTGFLSLAAARLGHHVTALDLSPKMLDQLRRRATAEGLDVTVVEGRAEDPPAGPFDAVVERHVVWTLPDPAAALAAWRAAAPGGRLVLFENLWGAADPVASARARARRLLQRVRRAEPDHHGSYSEELRASLPFGTGTPPGDVIELVERAIGGPVRLERLRDVEWAASLDQPLLERLVGTIPRFAVCVG